MTLAIRGDRTSCLSLQLGPRTWLLAIVRGFGSIGGVATESAVLTRLRAECERRSRSARFRSAVDRPQAAATAMHGVLSRVNGDLYASTASHEDYVTAAASLTAVVIVHGHAYVMHAGSTAAYLARAGEIMPLFRDDVFEEQKGPLLVRAVAVAPVLDVTISSAMLAPGDAIVLLGRRMRGDADRRAVLASLDAGDPGERVLIARFDRDDVTAGDAHAASPRPRGRAFARLAAAIASVVAAVTRRW
ncbi:MAG: hypothetical protein JO003_05335 [Candidatus Eremiobacteraeota bacterium]|nr:hypothetical protein [Candidatus Eremiobacteraeota bacterium]